MEFDKTEYNELLISEFHQRRCDKMDEGVRSKGSASKVT